MNDLETLNSVSTNAAFFQAEAFAAWVDMLRYAFDLAPNSTLFNDAKDRFELARSRCQREMDRLDRE